MSLCEIILCRIKTFGWKQKLDSLNSCLVVWDEYKRNWNKIIVTGNQRQGLWLELPVLEPLSYDYHWILVETGCPSFIRARIIKCQSRYFIFVHIIARSPTRLDTKVPYKKTPNAYMCTSTGVYIMAMLLYKCVASLGKLLLLTNIYIKRVYCHVDVYVKKSHNVDHSSSLFMSISLDKKQTYSDDKCH